MFPQVALLAVAIGAVSARIPLKNIWAHDMPGTKNVAELEPDAQSKVPKADRDRPLALGIRQSLQYQVGQVPGEGFVVTGTGRSALQAAHDVLTDKKRRQSGFPTNSELSIVFFSYQFGDYIHLESVEQSKNVIEIRYRFVPHMTREVTEHFAIIPLGKLEPGKYQVDIVNDSAGSKAVESPMGSDQGWANKVICKSFSFSVSDGK